MVFDLWKRLHFPGRMHNWKMKTAFLAILAFLLVLVSFSETFADICCACYSPSGYPSYSCVTGNTCCPISNSSCPCNSVSCSYCTNCNCGTTTTTTTPTTTTTTTTTSTTTTTTLPLCSNTNCGSYVSNCRCGTLTTPCYGYCCACANTCTGTPQTCSYACQYDPSCVTTTTTSTTTTSTTTTSTTTTTTLPLCSNTNCGSYVSNCRCGTLTTPCYGYCCACANTCTGTPQTCSYACQYDPSCVTTTTTSTTTTSTTTTSTTTTTLPQTCSATAGTCGPCTGCGSENCGYCERCSGTSGGGYTCVYDENCCISCQTLCKNKGYVFGECIKEETANNLPADCPKESPEEGSSICKEWLRRCWCYSCNRYCDSDEVSITGREMIKINPSTARLEITLSSSANCQVTIYYQIRRHIAGSSDEIIVGTTSKTVGTNSGTQTVHLQDFTATIECSGNEEERYHFDAWLFTPDKPLTGTKSNEVGLCANPPPSDCGGSNYGISCPECKVPELGGMGPTCSINDQCSCTSCLAGGNINPDNCLCWGGVCKNQCPALCAYYNYSYAGCKTGKDEVNVFRVSDGNSNCDTLDGWYLTPFPFYLNYECYCKCSEACGTACGARSCAANERCVYDDATNSCQCVPDNTCGITVTSCQGQADGTACSVNNQNGICCNQECRICDSTYCGSSLSCGSTYYCVYENGQWKWKTSKPSNFCCSDENCKDAQGNWRYDPVNHTKIVCDCPSGSCSLKKDFDYTCKPLPKCDVNEQCAPGWCCTADPALGADAASVGSCSYNSTNPIYKNKYLCDPPEWNSEKASKKQSLLDLLLSLFFNPFS